MGLQEQLQESIRVYRYSFSKRGHVKSILDKNVNSKNSPHMLRRWRKSSDSKDYGRRLAKAKAIAEKTEKLDGVNTEVLRANEDYMELIRQKSRGVVEDVEPQYVACADRIANEDWKFVDELMRNQDKFKRLRSHWLHLSKDDPSQVAYYPSLSYFRADRVVRTKFGRYLTKYAKAMNLEEHEIQELVQFFNKQINQKASWELKFIESDDEAGWVRVYDEGPQSCMKGESAVGVYAHSKSELRLAYLESDGDILARSIVRDTAGKEGYVRIYPPENGTDEGRWLLDKLAEQGYSSRVTLDGCLLQHETYGSSSVVAPYLDGGSQWVGVVVVDGKSYLRVGYEFERDGYECTNTNGVADYSGGVTCDDCDDTVDEDYTTNTGDGRCVCEYCRDNHYTYARSRRGDDYYHNDDVTEVGNDWYVTDDLEYFDIYLCEWSDTYYHERDLVRTDRGLVYEDYVTRLDHETEDGFDYAVEHDAVTLTDGTVCLDSEVHTLSNGDTCHESEAEEKQAEIDAALEADEEITTPTNTVTEQPAIAA